MRLHTSLCNYIVKNQLSTTSSLRSSDVVPVELSYNAYDKIESDPPVSPVLVLHGLFGSKFNWNSLSKAFHQKTKPTRTVSLI